MTVVARIDSLIANLQGLKQAVAAERGTGFEVALNAALDEAQAAATDAVTNTSLATISRDGTTPLNADTQNLMSLQKALRGSYTVSPSEDGRFEVRYPTGGVAGVFETEALATRMARVLAAGKASMIYSANRVIEREPTEDAELRTMGFSDTQIDAAYQRQIDNRDDARDRLQGMIRKEANARANSDSGLDVYEFYKLLLPNLRG